MSTPKPSTAAEILEIIKSHYADDLDATIHPKPGVMPSVEYLQLAKTYDMLWLRENPYASLFDISEAITRVTSAIGCINARLYLLEQKQPKD